MLFPIASLLVSLTLSCIYIAAIILSSWPQCRLNLSCLVGEEMSLSRWRLLGMMMGCALVLLIALWLVWLAPRTEPNCIGTRELMGLHGQFAWWRDVVKPGLGTTTLLLAPLASILTLQWQGDWRGLAMSMLPNGDPWSLVKTLLVAPVCEEIVYRASLIAILDQWGGWPPTGAILWSSLWFSLSHGYRLIFDQSELIPIGIQMGFTGLFGLYAGCLFIMHRQVIAPIVAHIIANAIGFPDIDGLMQLEPFKLMILGGIIPASIGLWIALYL